jgi:toluene monooxygenase system protein E
MYAQAPGSAVKVPMLAFYETHGPNAQLRRCDWEAFADPLATTYAKYVERQRDRELVVQTLLDGMDTSGYDRGLSASWRTRLGTTLSALRFVGHGLQMLAAYLGRLSPASPLVIAFAFQAADELRRVQRFAYRLCQLADLDAATPQRGRDAWQSAPEWQPLRRLMETLLVTWDWVQCFVAVELLLKPLIDELTLSRWPRVGAEEGDALLPLWTASLHEDARWHRDLAFTLTRVVLAGHPDNARVIGGALDRWRAAVREGLEPLATHLVATPWVDLTREHDENLEHLLGGTP